MYDCACNMWYQRRSMSRIVTVDDVTQLRPGVGSKAIMNLCTAVAAIWKSVTLGTSLFRQDHPESFLDHCPEVGDGFPSHAAWPWPTDRRGCPASSSCFPYYPYTVLWSNTYPRSGRVASSALACRRVGGCGGGYSGRMSTRCPRFRCPGDPLGRSSAS